MRRDVPASSCVQCFCSTPCARKKNGGQNRKAEVWWINAKGYTEGRIRTEDGVRQVKLHRHLMELHIGRKLMAHEDVHHRDGNKQNNAIENLEVLTHSEHARISNAGRIYRRGYSLRLTDAERAERSRRASERHARARGDAQ